MTKTTYTWRRSNVNYICDHEQGSVRFFKQTQGVYQIVFTDPDGVENASVSPPNSSPSTLKQAIEKMLEARLNKDAPEAVSQKEAAEIMGFKNLSSVRDYILSGRLEAIKVEDERAPWITMASINSFMNSKNQTA